MPIVLMPADGEPRLLAPTTTIKLAQRVLVASRVLADALPAGVNTAHALDILLELYVGEESARYPLTDELDPPSAIDTSVTRRWIAALIQKGLVERRNDLLALTPDGHARMTEFLSTLYAAQRALD